MMAPAVGCKRMLGRAHDTQPGQHPIGDYQEMPLIVLNC
jgi:hypothetical protein